MNNILGTLSDDTLQGTAGDDFLSGLAGNDRLIGGDGKDILDGGIGADTMASGLGNDIYYVDSLGDEVTEAGGEGIDTVRLQLAGGGLEFLYKLSANVENLEMLGTADLYAWGNELDNVMTGNSGDNLLSGLGGNDTLNGGAGSDKLFGGDGNDILDGGTGADTMDGGLGNDIYYVDSLGDVVTEAADGGIDTVRLQLTGEDARPVYCMPSSVENLEMQGVSELKVFGNELDNVITGNSGDDYMNGLVGDDTLYGGKGNDSLDGCNGDDTLYGGDGRDNLLGQMGNDTIYGGDGSDFLSGEGGNDTLYGGDGDDHLDDGDGNDTLYGGDGRDSLTGGDGNDRLFGGKGGDTLIASGGNDILTGGAGSDIFQFNNLNGADHITDFKHGQDMIWLDSVVFTKIADVGITDKNFSIHAGGHATRASDRIIYDKHTGKLYYDADGSGHHYNAVLIAVLDNHAKLTASDIYMF